MCFRDAESMDILRATGGKGLCQDCADAGDLNLRIWHILKDIFSLDMAQQSNK